jgi:PKD repeat protein
VTGSHTYTANGTYTIGVTVTDDDSGVGSNSLTDAFATKNVASNFLEPINAAGTRSVFKLGSTIPLKIRVTGCDGFSVTGLAPVISSIKVDSTAGDSINENTVSTATPTTGTTMRWADTQYIYNFSTKNSTMSNLPSTLTAGTYTVTASDQSFYAPVTATFDLKK